MAHTKSQGAANRTVNVAGKRLGVKRFAGEVVNSGTIIVKQRGTVFQSGKNTGVGRDHTIYATAAGQVVFTRATGFKRGKKVVNILPLAD